MRRMCITSEGLKIITEEPMDSVLTKIKESLKDGKDKLIIEFDDVTGGKVYVNSATINVVKEVG